MTAIKRLFEYIQKDVENENEAKMRSVIMRVFILLLALYFPILSVFMMFANVKLVPILSAFLFLLCCLLFHATYINKTKLVVSIIQIACYLWIVSFVYLFGWDCGTQHFLFVLLIFCFLCSYYGLSTNLVFASIYCLTRIALYAYTKMYDPVYRLSDTASILFQLLNTLTIFSEITFLIYCFSKESILIEKKLASYNQKIKELASIDPLTGLKNRRAMMEYLNQKIDSTDSIPSFCIAIADIDFFKKVNDTYGHDAGDEILRCVSAILSDHMKHKGAVARWGGEEFLFYFKESNGDMVYDDLDALRHKIQNADISYKDQVIPITMTFGLQEYTSYKPLDYTITHADKKLYNGKEKGRNCVVF